MMPKKEGKVAVLPLHYLIHLEPDLENFLFNGEVRILMKAETSVSKVILNGASIRIHSCSVLAGGIWQLAKFTQPKKSAESFSVSLPEPVSGEISIRLKYSGEINDTMLGFYRSSYSLETGEEKHIAVTQFEEAHARKAFPCFDHPNFKATFDLEFVLEKNLTGISNMPVSEEIPWPDSEGKKLVRFIRTPRMSTYLLFFGMGDFEIREKKGRILYRTITTPGKIDLADEALEFVSKCVPFLEELFGTPYPLPKLDLIAVPDFAFGAMENWGAMTFRENLLLVYPGITSRNDRRRLFAVIAHEIVHQWFGDLVSPSEWKYLWLNESFATIYADVVLDHFYPEWRTWDSFLLETTAGALGRDSLCANIPVELDKEARITASTAPIIYDKGGSVLRMVTAYLEEGLSRALKDYFDRHAFETAESADLWEAFGRALPGDPISAMMESWVRQPGHPLIKVERKGTDLRLKQERYTYSGRKKRAQWIIPLAVMAWDEEGRTEVLKFTLTQPMERITLGDSVKAYKINPGQTGFYRVKYTEKEWDAFGPLIADRILDGIDRFGLQEDLFALARRGDIPVSRYLAYLDSHYQNETDSLPLRGMLKNLSLAHHVLQGPLKSRTENFGRDLAEKILNRIGFYPSAEEDMNTAALRSSALWQAALFGSLESVRFALEQYDHFGKTGEAIHSDIAGAVQRIAVWSRPEAFEEMASRFERSDSEQERMILAAAMGSVQTDRLEQSVQFALEKIPPRLRFVPLSVMSGIPQLSPHLWDLFLRHRERLEELPEFHYERILIGVITSGGLYHSEDIKTFFKTYAPKKLKSYLPYLRQTLDMALEILEALIQLRRQSGLD
jgi:aminopeptidase N